MSVTSSAEITHQYDAWTIVWTFKNDPRREPVFAYKYIGGKLPFFTTRQDAAQFRREHRYEYEEGIEWHVVRVSVVATASVPRE